MNAANMLDRFLEQMRNRGLTIEPGPAPGTLAIKGPAAEKTPEVMAAIKQFKPQLLERLGLPVVKPEQKAKPVEPEPVKEEELVQVRPETDDESGHEGAGRSGESTLPDPRMPLQTPVISHPEDET